MLERIGLGRLHGLGISLMALGFGCAAMAPHIVVAMPTVASLAYLTAAGIAFALMRGQRVLEPVASGA